MQSLANNQESPPQLSPLLRAAPRAGFVFGEWSMAALGRGIARLLDMAKTLWTDAWATGMVALVAAASGSLRALQVTWQGCGKAVTLKRSERRRFSCNIPAAGDSEEGEGCGRLLLEHHTRCTARKSSR